MSERTTRKLERSRGLGSALMVLALLQLSFLHAQSPVIDSLRERVGAGRLQGNAADTVLARDLVLLTNKLLGAGEYDSVAQRGAQAMALLEQLRRPGTEDFASGQVAFMHRVLGRRSFYLSDYPGAIRELQDAFRISETLGDTVEMGTTLNLMTYSFRELRDTAAALDHSRRAIQLLSSIAPTRELAMGLMNLGGTYSYIGNTDSAVHYLRLALDLYNDLGPRSQVAAAHLNLSELYNGTGQFDSSIHHFQQAMPHASFLGLGGQVRFHGMHGRVLLLQNRPQEALEEIRIAEEMAEDGPTEMAVLNELKGLAFASMGRMKDAIVAMRSSREAIEEDLGLDKVREVTELRMAYEQDIEKALAATQLEQQKRQKRYVAIGAVLLAIIALLLFRSYRISRRSARSLRQRNEELITAQHELVRSEKQREAEQVRTRIARDIHDEIGGDLTRIRLLGNEVRHLMESDQEAASATIERMARSAQEATGSLRDIVWATDPGRDTVKGLVDHLPDLLHRQLEGSGITAELNVQHDGPDREVDPAWKSQVLRIVKEAVNNAVKYSGARSIGLMFRSDSHGFQLTIRDDGRGFLPANTSDGNGLRNMRARSAAIHGEFDLSTAAGEGCTITVTGPLPAGMTAA